MRTDDAYVSMMAFEKQVDSFLSSNFLQYQSKKFVFIEDKELQYKGLDLSCENGLLIDSKIKNTKMINQIFDYPSVEITIKHNRELGWFVKNGMLTNSYMFISVFSDETDYKKITADKIEKLNILLFSKKALKDYIERIMPLQSLVEEAMQMDDFDDRRNYFDTGGKKAFHLKYSPYNEGAINCVLKREVLKNLKGTREFNIFKIK